MLGSQKETWVERREKICIPSHLEQRRKGDIIWRLCSPEANSLKKKSTSVKVWCAPDLRGQMKIVYVAQEGVGRRKEQAHMETYALRSYLKNKACSGERNITSVLHTGRPPVIDWAWGGRERHTQTRSDIMSCQMTKALGLHLILRWVNRTQPSGNQGWVN